MSSCDLLGFNVFGFSSGRVIASKRKMSIFWIEGQVRNGLVRAEVPPNTGRFSLSFLNAALFVVITRALVKPSLTGLKVKTRIKASNFLDTLWTTS